MLIVSSLVRNESAKYWRSCLEAWSQFADKIVVLDDASEDQTLAIAREFPKVISDCRIVENLAMWGQETWARQAQWNFTMENSKEGDAILILDADMVPARDPRDFLDPEIDIYYFALYDLWDSLSIQRCSTDAVSCLTNEECECPIEHRLFYREDSFWYGHHAPRVWMVRRPPDDFKPIWSKRGIHCGHLPLNLPAARQLYAPRSYSLLHYAYADPRDRSAKHLAYTSLHAQLSPQEFAHADSILDADPSLKPLPFTPQWHLQRAT